MTFQFSQTSALADQIAQLTEQLNKLTEAIAPLRECEQQAAELLEQVTNHAQIMRDKGIENQSLIDWANQMYMVITDVSIEALHQEISDLKSSNKVLRTEREQLEKRLDIYKQDTQEIDSYTRELQQLREENANYQARYEGQKAQKEQWESDYYKIRAQRDELQRKLQQLSLKSNEKDELTNCEQESNTPEENFILGDIVQHVNGQVGTITYIPEPFNGIVSVKMVNGNSNYHTTNLKLVSRPSEDSTTSSDPIEEEEKVVNSSSSPESTNLDSPSNSEEPQPLTEAQAQTIGNEFIKSITSKADVDQITWATIKQVSQGDNRVLKEMALTARTKVQKQFIENIPELLAAHIKLTGDSEDLNWVNSIIKTKAAELLEQKYSLQRDLILQAVPEELELNLQALEVSMSTELLPPVKEFN